jgi:hypothetical protein
VTSPIARIFVDHDGAGRVRLHADSFETDVLDVRRAADGEHHLIGGVMLAVREHRLQCMRLLFDRGDGLAENDLDPPPHHLRAHVLADVVVKAAQDLVAAVNERHVGAEAAEQAGEFRRDVAAALDHDPPRQLGKLKRLVRGDRVLRAGNERQHRMGAVREQDRLGMHARAGFQEPERARVLDDRARLRDLDRRAREIGVVGRLQPGDLLVLVGDQRRPVELGAGYRPAEAGGVLELVRKTAGVDQELLRNAAADHAGAADAILLGDHDARAVPGCDARRAHAARAGTDHEQIDIVFGHSLSPSPAGPGASRP